MHGKFANFDHMIMQFNEDKEERGDRREEGGSREEIGDRRGEGGENRERRRKEEIVFLETKTIRLSQCSNFAVFVCFPFPVLDLLQTFRSSHLNS